MCIRDRKVAVPSAVVRLRAHAIVASWERCPVRDRTVTANAAIRRWTRVDARGPRLVPLTCGDTVILPRLVHKRNARIAPGILLITQRSQVQILPPLQVKVQVRGPFDLRIEGASGVRDRTVTADAATGCGWIWVDSGVLGGHLRRYGAGYLSRPSPARRRCGDRRARGRQ